MFFSGEIAYHNTEKREVKYKESVPSKRAVEQVVTGEEGFKYKYNGKELQDELGLQWYDYGLRMYDPAIPRWNAIDPLTEKYYDFSGYCYVKNSPVYLNDILGADIYDVNGVKTNISYNKKGGITINNASDLDTETVSLIISTYLESKVGVQTIKKLLKKFLQTKN